MNHADPRHSVALIEIDAPPVNALGWAQRCSLRDAIASAAADPSVRAIVISGAGRGFCAGGDLHEADTEAVLRAPRLSGDLLPQIEQAGKPVIAALHGFAIGGGLELALACHARVAQADTRVGLPETRRGLLALSGSQRLPRALPFARALTMLVEGEVVGAASLASTELFHRVVAADAVGSAIALAREIVAGVLTLPTLLRRRPLLGERIEALRLIEAERERVRQDGPPSGTTQLAVLATLDALKAAFEFSDFDLGLARASAIFDALHRARGPLPVSAL